MRICRGGGSDSGLGFGEEPAEATEELVEAVFDGVVDEVVGTAVVYFPAGESFLEGGEAGPGVGSGSAFRGDTPEVKGFEALILCV